MVIALLIVAGCIIYLAIGVLMAAITHAIDEYWLGDNVEIFMSILFWPLLSFFLAVNLLIFVGKITKFDKICGWIMRLGDRIAGRKYPEETKKKRRRDGKDLAGWIGALAGKYDEEER
jgi:fructose-specific phosphotransferase system IIC component